MREKNFYWENMQCGTEIIGHTGPTCKISKRITNDQGVMTIQGFHGYININSTNFFDSLIRNIRFPKFSFEEGMTDFVIKSNAFYGSTRKLSFLRHHNGKAYITFKGVIAK